MDPNHGSFLDLISVCVVVVGGGVMMVMIMLLRPLYVQNETTVPLLLCFKFTFSTLTTIKAVFPGIRAFQGTSERLEIILILWMKQRQFLMFLLKAIIHTYLYIYIYGILLRFSKLSWKSIPE